MKDQTSKTAKNRASALGKAKAAALSLFGAGAVCLASARPAYAVDAAIGGGAVLMLSMS